MRADGLIMMRIVPFWMCYECGIDIHLGKKCLIQLLNAMTPIILSFI